MNDNAKKLVAALRSGEFEQGRDFLSRGGKFCCWGVACEIYQREVGGLWIEDDEYSSATYYDSHHAFPPLSVMEWIGINDENRVEYLAHLNDEGHTFSEIADIIESEPEGLFND